MFDFFGWYEISILLVIIGAHIHGIIIGKRESVETGAKLALQYLEKEGYIVVDEDGEIRAGANSK